MRRLSRVAPIAVTLALVSGVVWFALRPSGEPAAIPSPSSSSPSCQLVEPSLASGPATLTTPDWKVSVKEVRSATGLPREGGGVMPAEPGKVFVVGGLTFTRLGSVAASIRSDDISVVCRGGGGITPGYWSTDGERFCFPCSFDVTNGAPSTVIWFAFKVDRPRATSSFAVDYRGFGPVPLSPPASLP